MIQLLYSAWLAGFTGCILSVIQYIGEENNGIYPGFLRLGMGERQRCCQDFLGERVQVDIRGGGLEGKNLL